MGNKKQKQASHRKLLIIVAGVLSLLAFILSLMVAISWLRLNNINMESLATESIRQNLTRAIDDLSEVAPRDAASGDYYFPEAKLMLRNYEGLSGVNYSFDHNENYLRIITNQMTGSSDSKFYGAQTTERLFEVLPEHQACQSGIMLTRAKIDINSYQGLAEAGQKVLSNGQMIHMYKESDCPAHNDPANELLQSIVDY